MIKQGDCREVMPALDENSVDSVVCDPPYGLSFMGKGWDHGVPGKEFWGEALRVAKPGAYLLAFGGTRTHHRLMVAIEDAGWEIRDCVMWVYGSGFPKSLDVSKAIDKEAGAKREVIQQIRVRGGGMEHVNRTNADTHDYRPDGYQKGENVLDITAPSTDAAKQWQGWGTALKPAWEPIILARKPLIGTVAANVQQYGTGGLNIDGCRVPVNVVADASQIRTMVRNEREGGDGWGMSTVAGDVPQVVHAEGRWPANLIHDGSEEVLTCFPDSLGQQARARTDGEAQGNSVYGVLNHVTANPEPRNDTGSAARFFYCAKASRQDRDEGCAHLAPTVADTAHKRPRSELDDPRRAGVTPRTNSHPTVKPTALMRYLCRLVTPPGGTILDPFMGSGSTGKAALLEGFKFIGIELSPEYMVIAEARIAAAERAQLETLL